MSDSAPNVVVQQFGAVAQGYATSSIHASGPDLPLLVEAASPGPDDVALDIGTGGGHTAFAIARRCARVTAVDITEAMLAEARKGAYSRSLRNIEFEIADAQDLPYESESFDIVTCRVSAHHFPHPGRFVAETARVLRPGGRLVLVDTIAPEDSSLDTLSNTIELLRDRSHVRNWGAAQWLRMMDLAGLQGEVLHRSGYVLDGKSWVERMNTPPAKVAIIRELLAEASPAQRAYLEVRDNPWGWTVPYAIIRATRD
jgi:SAM-dependent methyltransferase